jgi:hypothetical protein
LPTSGRSTRLARAAVRSLDRGRRHVPHTTTGSSWEAKVWRGRRLFAGDRQPNHRQRARRCHQEPRRPLYFPVASSSGTRAMTPSYFHDRSIATLPDATKVMARAQLGAALGRNRNEPHRRLSGEPDQRASGELARGHQDARNSRGGAPARIDSSFVTSDSYLLNCFID